jgi:hypothetical protein
MADKLWSSSLGLSVWQSARHNTKVFYKSLNEPSIPVDSLDKPSKLMDVDMSCEKPV